MVASGTYGTQAAVSHAGVIVIENATDWAKIPINGVPTATASNISSTIPRGYTGFVKGITIGVEGAKLIDVLMTSRSGVLETAALARTRARGTGLFTPHQPDGIEGRIAGFTAPLGPRSREPFDCHIQARKWVWVRRFNPSHISSL